MPEYQKRVVHRYLQKYKPDYSPETWNSTGIVRETFSLIFNFKLIIDMAIESWVSRSIREWVWFFIALQHPSLGLNITPLPSANYVVAVCVILMLQDLATDIKCYQVEGDFVQVFGTSAAAPVVASILTMINDARLTVGKTPIGFINPTVCLYFSLLKLLV